MTQRFRRVIAHDAKAPAKKRRSYLVDPYLPFLLENVQKYRRHS